MSSFAVGAASRGRRSRDDRDEGVLDDAECLLEGWGEGGKDFSKLL